MAKKALGATRWRVFGELLRQGALRLAAGLVIGLGCYALVARLLDTTLLFGTGVYEPATLVSVVVVVALATLGGVAGAAGRVTRLDPLTALRSE